MDYNAPTDLKDALALLQSGGTQVIAGGTDWFAAQGETPFRGALLDVTRVSEFRGISRRQTGWRIGAAVTWSEIVAADLPPGFDGLKAAAREIGSLQIQNAATVAGNLCNASPAADGVPPLLTLGAQVEIVSLKGTRSLALGDFMQGARRTALQPGELVSALIIPQMGKAAQGAFLKLGSRRYLVISIAMAAALVTVQRGRITGARLAVGACSEVAQRLPALEAALIGRQVGDCTDVVRPQHLEGLAPISDIRGSAGYRSDAARELCQRVIDTAVAGRGHG